MSKVTLGWEKPHSFRSVMVLIIVLGCTGAARAQVQADTIKSEQQTRVSEIPSNLSHLAAVTDTAQFEINLARLPASATTMVGNLNVRGIDIRDLLRGLGREYDLNLIVDNNITRQATVRLADIPVIEALIYICQEYNLKLVQTGAVFRVHGYVPPQKKSKPRIPNISVDENGLLSFDLQGDNLGIVMRTLSQKTGNNIVVRDGVTGSLNGLLQDVSFEVGLQTILTNNGFMMREKDGIYVIDRTGMRTSEEGRNSQAFWINVDSSRVSMDVVNAPITDIIREISFQMDINMITYQLPSGTITAKINGLSLGETFSYLFRGTNFTYRKEDNIYIIGDKSISGIATTKLLRLNHIRADVVLELIPENIIQGASVQVSKEQNGLMVIGTNDIIFELEKFINEIDHPTPQIMIETLVIDVNSSDFFELGVTLAKGAAPDSSYLNPFAIFGARGADGRQSGGFVAQGDGDTANHWLGLGADLFGIQRLGRLPADFFFRIQALSQEGIVNIRSRPHISTLNGHEASIEIGTTQYFILKSTTPLQSPNQIVTQETERFETIEANVSLNITPWVSSSGEVTTEIHPEFNTPVGNFNSEVPPTINSRILDSTVRLKDGETIILGGLIQDTETVRYNKIPILGDIPLLGQLFRNRSHDNSKSELIIFITPHVFYGDGNDATRWQEIRDDYDLSTDQSRWRKLLN